MHECRTYIAFGWFKKRLIACTKKIKTLACAKKIYDTNPDAKKGAKSVAPKTSKCSSANKASSANRASKVATGCKRATTSNQIGGAESNSRRPASGANSWLKQGIDEDETDGYR
jgi:hypothetical protein